MEHPTTYTHGHGLVMPGHTPENYSVSRIDVQADRGQGVEYIEREELAARLREARATRGAVIESSNDIYMTENFTFNMEG